MDQRHDPLCRDTEIKMRRMSKRLLQTGKAARAIGSLQVDQAAREFLSKRILSEDPKYTPYQNPR